jgi:hypothetical protein
MRAVTTGTTDTTRQVFGLREILRFQAGLVTLCTDCCRLSGSQGFESNDFGDVPTAVDVRLAGAVASLAPMLVAFQKRGMRSSGKVFVPNFLVAGLADIGWGVLSLR